MLDTRLTWIIMAPLLGGLVAALFFLAQNSRRMPPRGVPWLRLAALLSALTGLAAQAVLLVIVPAGDTVTLDTLGITLTIATPARFVLLAADVALVCAAIVAWTGEDEAYHPTPEWALLGSSLTGGLLALAAMVGDPVVAAFAMLAAALPSAALALARPRSAVRQATDGDNLHTQTLLAKRISGGLKQLAFAVLGTGLLAVGAVLVARYAFNLENRSLLQLGIALLAVGIIVRSGGMPFAGPAADTIEAAPPAALMMLGAAGPVMLVVGLLILAPVEGSLARGAAAGWLGAIGTFLAGLRALGVMLEERTNAPGKTEDENLRHGRTTGEATLIAMTVAAATGWGTFGVLSGSQIGAIGAILIAANIALALPILVIHRQWTALGVASMLGLPPLGGFAGMIMVAQSAANAGGLWLGLLLAGSALVAAGWLSLRNPQPSSTAPDARTWLSNHAYIIPVVLLILQLALFLAAPELIANLTDWAIVPWLTAP